ncbi:MAG: AsmA family protein [Pseudohongiellaceae bacterium]
MKTVLKVLFGIVTVLVVVVLLSAAYITTRDPNDYKEWIAAEFRESTGRTLAVEGDIEVSFYPWLGLDVGRLTVSNAPGFGEEPMLAAENAAARVRLLPILRGEYRIDTLRLHGTRINLAVNESGESNWQDLVSEAGEEADEEAAGDGDGLQLENIILGGVDIRDGALRYEDRMAQLVYDIDDFDFTTGALTFGEPIDLNINFNASASQPALSGQVALTGTLLYDLSTDVYELSPLAIDSVVTGSNIPGGSTEVTLRTSVRLLAETSTLTVSDLSVSALDTEINGNLTGVNAGSARAAYRGDLQVNGDDLAQLFTILEIEPLATQLAAMDNQSFSLASDLSFDQGEGSVGVSGLEAVLLGSTIRGRLDASNLNSDAPLVQGNLNASGPDLPAVMLVLGQLSGGNESPLSQAARELDPITDRNFTIGTDFDADWQRGDITVSTVNAQLPGASVEGHLTASNVRSDSPVVAGRLNASGPDLPLLLRVAGRLQDRPNAQGAQESAGSPLYTYGQQLGNINNRSFSILAEFDADLTRGDIQVPVLEGQTLGFQLDGTVNTRDMNASGGNIDGSLDLTGENMGDLLRALGQPDLAEVVQSVTARIELGGSRADLSLSPMVISAVLSGPTIPNSPVTVALEADSRINLDSEELTVDSFALTGLGLDATGNLTANNILQSPAFQGQLNLAEFSPRRLLSQLNQEVPPMADREAFQRFALSTSFSGSADSLTLENVQMELDESTLQGRFAVSNFTTPAIDFEMEVDRIDADRYLAAETSPAAANGSAAGTTELPVEMLRNLQVNGDITLAALSVAGMTFADFAATMNAADGEVSLSPLRTQLYEGAFDGAARLSVSGEVPEVTLEVNLLEVAVEPLLQDLMDATYVSGYGNIELALSSNGGDTAALAENLDGSGRIELENGVLSGVDIVSVLGQIETMLRSRRIADLQRGEQTAFDTFSATLRVQDGVIASDDLLITSPGFRVTGQGTLLNLSDNNINYNLVTTVDESTATTAAEEYDIGGYSVPIACTGSLESPRCLPDAGEIVRTALAREAQRRVGDFINRTLGGDEPQSDDTQNGGSQNQPAQQDSQDSQQQDSQSSPDDAANELINRALDRLLR